jgi:hypothetical protein
MADNPGRQGEGPLGAKSVLALIGGALDKRTIRKLLALTTKRVGVTLRLQRVNGVVRSASGPGQYMVWEIAR